MCLFGFSKVCVRRCLSCSMTGPRVRSWLEEGLGPMPSHTCTRVPFTVQGEVPYTCVVLARSLKHTHKERVALTPIDNPGSRPSYPTKRLTHINALQSEAGWRPRASPSQRRRPPPPCRARSRRRPDPGWQSATQAAREGVTSVLTEWEAPVSPYRRMRQVRRVRQCTCFEPRLKPYTTLPSIR